MLYNPHTRSRRQASAVFDFLATGIGGGNGQQGDAIAGAGAGGADDGEGQSIDTGKAGGAAAASCAAASAKYFFDAVKHKSGLGKLLEIAMTSLQLSFTNSVCLKHHSKYHFCLFTYICFTFAALVCSSGYLCCVL